MVRQIGNHDQPRMTSRWGNDAAEFREPSSKMLTTFLLSMKGTPYYYNGDEIGMINAKFDKIEDYRDIQTIAEYEKVKIARGDLKEFIENQKTGVARDNGRTSFQWDSSKNGGFSKVEPWLKVNDNHKTLNAAAQEKDPNSVLNYFRKMVQLRKSNEVLVYGKYTLLDNKNPNVYAYARELNGKKLLVLLNFSSKNAVAKTGLNISKAKVLIDNYGKVSKNGELRPYEAVIYEL
jgi:oligo-1,6-glucosidase